MLDTEEIWLLGKPICRGIAIGTPLFFQQAAEAVQVQEYAIPEAQVEQEVERYYTALEKAKQEVIALQKRLQKEKMFDAAAILDAHLAMMEDPLLTTYIEEQIRDVKKNAEFLFDAAISACQKRFSTIEDPFFRERFKDIRDISSRISDHLKNRVRSSLSDIPQNSIIFTDDLTAFDSAEAKSDAVAAFVTTEGGPTSHAAIVARAKGIPYVSNISFDKIAAKESQLIVDGRTGHIILNPAPKTLAKYTELKEQLQLHMQKVAHRGTLAAETFDGYGIQLSANIEMLEGVELLHRYGGHGIGLLRSETFFLSRGAFPSEEEQFRLYQHLVQQMKGLKTVIRAFDVGGDKYAHLISQPGKESNPFLGCRAIRFLLREREIFKTQLRAILRASTFGTVWLMFPMISSLSELQEAKQVLQEAKRELREAQLPFTDPLPVGCMIEVPSAALIADLLAKECNFLSIGTNDLVQYALAVDRSNSWISSLYSPFHPSVVRLIKLVAAEGEHNGVSVSICGEIAADPRFTPLLLGLGIQELSVAPRFLPVIKNAIRNTSIVSAYKLAEQVLKMRSTSEIEEFLTQEYRKNVPEDYFYNFS
jgi:phosphotransferase system enzyme I (PtsI)